MKTAHECDGLSAYVVLQRCMALSTGQFHGPVADIGVTVSSVILKLCYYFSSRLHALHFNLRDTHIPIATIVTTVEGSIKQRPLSNLEAVQLCRPCMENTHFSVFCTGYDESEGSRPAFLEALLRAVAWLVQHTSTMTPGICSVGKAT